MTSYVLRNVVFENNFEMTVRSSSLNDYYKFLSRWWAYYVNLLYAFSYNPKHQDERHNEVDDVTVLSENSTKHASLFGALAWRVKNRWPKENPRKLGFIR